MDAEIRDLARSRACGLIIGPTSTPASCPGPSLFSFRFDVRFFVVGFGKKRERGKEEERKEEGKGVMRRVKRERVEFDSRT
jgi:hypothetical protein